MANAAAMINEGLWRKDKDFQKLPRLAQCTFCQVLSQKDLDTAGVLTLHLDLLAKACDELTVEQLMVDFAVLEEHRFLFVDYDTDELLVRSYARLVSGTSQKNNAWLSVPKNARLLASERLRHELATELRRLRWKQAVELADEIDPVGTPLGPPSDPLPTRSQGDTPLEGGRDPHSLGLVPELVSPPAVGYLGKPRPECGKHEENSDESCWDCGQRRIWDDENAELIAANELEQKRLARVAALKAQLDCPFCDEGGWVTGDDGKPVDPAVKCLAHKAS